MCDTALCDGEDGQGERTINVFVRTGPDEITVLNTRVCILCCDAINTMGDSTNCAVCGKGLTGLPRVEDHSIGDHAWFCDHHFADGLNAVFGLSLPSDFFLG